MQLNSRGKFLPGAKKKAEFRYGRVGCDWDVAQIIEWAKATLREACGGINEAARLEVAEDGKERMTELISPLHNQQLPPERQSPPGLRREVLPNVTRLLSGSASVLPHLITLSALTNTFGGIVNPICFAASD